jgi:hypothetical protein
VLEENCPRHGYMSPRKLGGKRWREIKGGRERVGKFHRRNRAGKKEGEAMPRVAIGVTLTL